MSAYDSSELTSELQDIEYSCEFIDLAIANVEKAREIHGDLRTLIVKTIDTLEEKESEYADLEDENKMLRGLIDDLKSEVDSLKDQLADAEAYSG